MAMKRWQDKIAIITGGSGGIGKAVAERFLGEGARVMLVDIDQDGLDATRQALGGGDRIAITKADVSNESDVARYAERSEEHTSELQSLMRISYAVFCLKKKKDNTQSRHTT